MQELHRASVTLVLGGARSGKSHYALKIVSRWPSVHFVATAQARDSEMREKIERHRSERPAHWRTSEEPLQVDRAIANRDAECPVVLVDCLTLWAANLMEHYRDDTDGMESAIVRLCDMVVNAGCELVIVSNEVGSGIVPEYESGREFRELLGKINQRVAAIADNVVLMVAGLPLAIKGTVEAAR
jgi:adenosylcobinamide kinase/adenosylcobinamide-phosphate guanylyltransferase